MTIDAWPAQLSCGLVDFELIGGGRSAGTSAGGLPQAIDASSGGPHWIARVGTLPLRTAVEIAAARALEGRLDGGAAPVMIKACVGDLSPQIPGGAAIGCTLGASALAGATSLHLVLTGAHYDIVGSELFNVDDADVDKRLHAVIEVTGGTTDAPIVTISPPLRAALANGAPVYFTDLTCPMRLADGFDLPVSLGRFSAIEATFEEWFEPAIVLALRTLTLSPHSVETASPEDTFVGYLLGTTAGSAVTITDTAGGKFKLVDNGGGIWSIVAGASATDYGSAHSHNITVRETLAGYLNTPHDSVLTVNVTLPVPTSLVLNITNPGFETGDLTGWWVSDPSVVVLGTVAGQGAPHDGSWMVYGGNVGSSQIYQIGDGDSGDPFFDVSSLADRIDTGHVVLQGWNSYQRDEASGQGDTGHLVAYFCDAAGDPITVASHVDSPHIPGWDHLVMSDTTSVPVGTRKIVLGGESFRVIGPALQNFFDTFASAVTLQYSP